MIYSELYFKNRVKIPTIIGFLSILFVVFVFARFFANTATLSRASKKTLKRIEIGNLLHNQVTIFWQTEDKEAGWVLSGEEKGKETKITLDERDVGSQKNKFYSHYVILKELKENQRYFLKLVGDDKLITSPEGDYFSFVTPKNTVVGLQNIGLANGFVKEANLVDPLADAVVILSVENKNVYPLLTRTAIDGSWIIPLNGFYGKDNQEPVTIKEKDKIKIEFISEEEDMSTVITNLSNISPLPQTIVIGAKTSSTGKIFGSVNNIQVAEALKEKGFEVDRKQITIKEDSIKEIGKHTAKVKFHREVVVEFEFEVVAE